jgi:formate hydrogenlyase subunit 3/multisubunit Na+/H+ antiporter MnhD subunit
MKELLYLIIDIFTRFHLFFLELNISMDLNLDDKELHFFVIGFLCLFIFVFVQFWFKRLAKWNISIISFIYTLTVAVVITFSVEIGQWKTGTGNMEFADIVFGLYGFIAIFIVYELLVFIARMILKLLKKLKTRYELMNTSKKRDF